jgi:hypothetical protein
VDDLSNLDPYAANADYDLGCDSFSDGNLVCADLVSGPGSVDGSFIWVVASRSGGFPDGIGGLQFGIQYSGLGGVFWTLCTGGSEIPEAGWPNSGTGNAVTWSGGCYEPGREVAKVGYVLAFDGTSGSFAIIGDPRLADFAPEDAQWADCSAAVWSACPENRGFDDNIGDGANPDCDTCTGTPVRETSWGTIKSLFCFSRPVQRSWDRRFPSPGTPVLLFVRQPWRMAPWLALSTGERSDPGSDLKV